jgi:uncharacterized protein YegP (UPF0339 family)
MNNFARLGGFAMIAATLVALPVTFVGPAAPARAAAAAEPKAAPATFEVYKDKGGEFRWRLRAQNSQVIATSGDGYKEKRSCLAAVESVKRDAAAAPVQEVD